MSPKLSRILKTCFSNKNSYHKTELYLDEMAGECLIENGLDRSDANNYRSKTASSPRPLERNQSKTPKSSKTSKTSSLSRTPTPFKSARPSNWSKNQTITKKCSKDDTSNIETVKKSSKFPVRSVGEFYSAQEKLKHFIDFLSIALEKMDVEIAANLDPIPDMTTALYHENLIRKNCDYNLWWHVIKTKYISTHSADEIRSMFLDALSIIPLKLDRPQIGCYGPHYLDWLAYVCLWLHFIEWSISLDINEAEQIVNLFNLCYANKFYDSRIFLLVGKYVTSVRASISSNWRRGNAYCSASHDLYEFYINFYIRKIGKSHDALKVVSYVQQYISFSPNSSRVRSFCFELARNWKHGHISCMAKSIILMFRKHLSRIDNPELYYLEYLRVFVHQGNFGHAYRYYDSLIYSKPGDSEYVNYIFSDDPRFQQIYLQIMGGLVSYF